MDVVLSALQVAIPVSLYVFLAATALLIWCESRADAGRLPAAGESMAQARLVVRKPGDTGMIVGDVMPLKASTLIGRALENTIILPDGSVSTRHAALSFENGEWWLTDMNSTNGTAVNGQAVHLKTRVLPRDVITFGKIELALEYTYTLESDSR